MLTVKFIKLSSWLLVRKYNSIQYYGIHYICAFPILCMWCNTHMVKLNKIKIQSTLYRLTLGKTIFSFAIYCNEKRFYLTRPIFKILFHVILNSLHYHTEKLPPLIQHTLPTKWTLGSLLYMPLTRRRRFIHILPNRHYYTRNVRRFQLGIVCLVYYTWRDSPFRKVFVDSVARATQHRKRISH